MAKQYHRLLKANLAHGAMSVFKKSWEMRNRGLYKNPLKRPLLPGWGLALEGLTLRFSMKKKTVILGTIRPIKKSPGDEGKVVRCHWCKSIHGPGITVAWIQ